MFSFINLDSIDYDQSNNLTVSDKGQSIDSLSYEQSKYLTMAEEERKKGRELKESQKKAQCEKFFQMQQAEFKKNQEIAVEKRQLIVILHGLISSRLAVLSEQKFIQEQVRAAVREFKCDPHLLDFFPIFEGKLHISTTDRSRPLQFTTFHNLYKRENLPTAIRSIHHFAELRHLTSRDVWTWLQQNPIRFVQDRDSKTPFFEGMGIRVTATQKTIGKVEEERGKLIDKGPSPRESQYLECYELIQYGLNIHLFGDKTYTNYKDIPKTDDCVCVIM